jgi:phosphopentomutase
MANRNKAIQEKIRLFIADAVRMGLRSPDEIVAYLVDNGWDTAELPTKPTIIEQLRKNGVDYIQGHWELMN